MPHEPYAVEMRGITKRFGTITANRAVDFALRKGEVQALLGENGAGKTTLMRILYGLYHADEGDIFVDGQMADIRSPRHAIAHGVGMVTQHFALVPPITVTENIILGYTDRFNIDLDAAHNKVAEASRRFGIAIEPRALVKNLSVGERQRVEIIKALYRDAKVLILDEPTAVLAPQEADELFESLKRLRDSGLSVIFISHKLHEVMAITDRVTVLRSGELAGTVNTAETNQADLAKMMVGRETFGVTKSDVNGRQGDIALRLEKISALDSKELVALKEISFEVRTGEILGLAGVSGNGQSELAQVLEGTRPSTGGRVSANGREITNAGPEQIMATGVGRIPEDRHESVVAEMTVAQNMALEHLHEFVRRGMLDKKRIRAHAETLIEAYQIKARPNDRIRTLSGGNMQKVILARVLERNPSVIIVAQPTRGLDVGATEYVRQKLLEQRQRGAAILLISEDLDEILELSDRIAVIYEGEIMNVLPAAEADIERLGLLMCGVSV
ncbi:MAG: ABC transporter ATP-binding protein [Halieaceae bacterium]|nr:ABC transporter ATP-binding protein [Halieaceae bacterium]